MSTSGTPNSGLAEIAKRYVTDGPDLTLIAYTNTADSLGPNSVAADLVQPTGSGYAPIVLDSTYTITNGIIGYDLELMWTAGGPWSLTVTGVAIIYGAALMHFKDITPWVASNLRKLKVTIPTVLV